MSTLVVLFCVSSIIFIFSYWRSLKEDYSSETIFGSALTIIALIALAAAISKLLIDQKISSKLSIHPSGVLFWLTFILSQVGFLLSSIRSKMRLTEAYESFSIAFLYFIIPFFLADSLKNSSIFSLGYSALIISMIFLYYFLDTHYKNFTWYKSGKIGFSGLTTLGFFFLTRAILALFFPIMLSFTGKAEGIISALISFVYFLAVYNLSRRKV